MSKKTHKRTPGQNPSQNDAKLSVKTLKEASGIGLMGASGRAVRGDA
jgi:hypothetical protein